MIRFLSAASRRAQVAREPSVRDFGEKDGQDGEGAGDVIEQHGKGGGEGKSMNDLRVAGGEQMKE